MMTRRISVRAIVLRDGKLLCVRLKQNGNILKTSEWCLPGGGLDEGESLLAGVEREMMEETGVKSQIGKLLYVQQFAYNDIDYLEFFFHVTNADDYVNVDLSKTTHGAHEIAEIAFIDPASTDLLPKFLMTEPLVEKASKPSPTTIFSSL